MENFGGIAKKISKFLRIVILKFESVVHVQIWRFHQNALSALIWTYNIQ